MQAKDVVGKTVVLTGKFSEVKRAEAEAALSRLGAKIGSGVAKTTDILFVGERAGSKLKKAKTLGVEIADEAALVALLAQAPEPGPEPEPEPEPSTGQAQVDAFAGKAIALTGTFTTMKRSDAKKVLTEAGASVGSGVTKKTDLLIYGDNAGSKLDKAHEYGVAMMTEAEMVALLTAGGGGAEQLAGASEKLAQKQAEDAAGANAEMQAVVAELRAFVAGLKKRKDIRVSVAKLGRKAGKSKLAQLDGVRAPQELIDLYAEIDGVHVEWSFIEPPGGGCMRIPPVSQWTRFTTDDDHYMGFGDDQEALLLDEITPEGSTWLVRAKQTRSKTADRSAEIIFASAAEGAEGVVAAGSIVEYLRASMQNGFVGYWPRCFAPNRYVSYADWEAAIERFRGPAVAPSKFVVGGRVHVSYFSEGGRGEILSTHQAPESDATSFPGRDFLEVRLDLGGVAWFPTQSSKAWAKTDAYERLRDPGFDLAAAAKADPAGLFDDLARTIGPVSSYSTGSFGTYASNARLGAGLLSARPYTEAAELVVELHEALTKAKLGLERERKFAKTGDEFQPTELSRLGWKYRPQGILIGLCDGLRILAHHESAQRDEAPAKLVPAKLRARLAELPGGEALSKCLAGKKVLAAPRWGHGEGDQATALGLPAGAPVLMGSGF